MKLFSRLFIVCALFLSSLPGQADAARITATVVPSGKASIMPVSLSGGGLQSAFSPGALAPVFLDSALPSVAQPRVKTPAAAGQTAAQTETASPAFPAAPAGARSGRYAGIGAAAAAQDVPLEEEKTFGGPARELKAEVRGPAGTESLEALHQGARFFDGGTRIKSRTDAPSQSHARSAGRGFWSRLNPFAGRPKNAYSYDRFSGPPKVELRSEPSDPSYRARAAAHGRTFINHVLYGAKWAINMTGIAALLGLAVKPLAALAAWQNLVSDSFLEFGGRVELMTSMGYHELIAAVAQEPASFLFGAMPVMVLMEELTYRLASFGLLFLAIAALKPAMAYLETILKEIPNLFGIPAFGIRAARLAGRLPRLAFPAALAYSSWTFAAAHVAAWGFSPTLFAIHAAMGTALAFAAYRSRGIVAPLTAHYLFNLIAVSVGILAPLALLPGTATALTALTGVFSLAFLYYNFRLHLREKAAGGDSLSRRSWKFASAALALPLLLSAYLGLARVAAPPDLSAYSEPAQTEETQKTGPFLSDELRKFLQTEKKEARPEAEAKEPEAEIRAEMTAEQIAAAAKPAVVMVRVGKGMGLGLGTGFIIEKDGLLVTNAHVVKNGDSYEKEVTIRFTDKRELPGTVVGFNAGKDIALIRLPESPHDYPVVSLGDSRALREGEPVLAIGHPRGMPYSVAQGIVSGLGFRSNGFVSFIQHDASVNPGNSGGPLFNKYGEVVGINTLIMSSGGGFDGISFSITTEDLKTALSQFAESGHIDPASMGAIFHPGGPHAPPFGLYLDAVRPGSPAESAGLLPGDVLVDVDGNKFSNHPAVAIKQLIAYLRQKTPSEKIAIKLSRDGSVIDLTLTLGRNQSHSP